MQIKFPGYVVNHLWFMQLLYFRYTETLTTAFYIPRLMTTTSIYESHVLPSNVKTNILGLLPRSLSWLHAVKSNRQTGARRSMVYQKTIRPVKKKVDFHINKFGLPVMNADPSLEPPVKRVDYLSHRMPLLSLKVGQCFQGRIISIKK